MGWRGRLYPPRSLRSLQRSSQRRASEKTRDPLAEEGRKDRAAGGGRVPSFAEDVLARRAERYNDFKGILRYLDP